MFWVTVMDSIKGMRFSAIACTVGVDLVDSVAVE